MFFKPSNYSVKVRLFLYNANEINKTIYKKYWKKRRVELSEWDKTKLQTLIRFNKMNGLQNMYVLINLSFYNIEHLRSYARIQSSMKLTKSLSYDRQKTFSLLLSFKIQSTLSLFSCNIFCSVCTKLLLFYW